MGRTMHLLQGVGGAGPTEKCELYMIPFKELLTCNWQSQKTELPDSVVAFYKGLSCVGWDL